VLCFLNSYAQALDELECARGDRDTQADLGSSRAAVLREELTSARQAAAYWEEQYKALQAAMFDSLELPFGRSLAQDLHPLYPERTESRAED
jgi:hypothetical protein